MDKIKVVRRKVDGEFKKGEYDVLLNGKAIGGIYRLGYGRWFAPRDRYHTDTRADAVDHLVRLSKRANP